MLSLYLSDNASNRLLVLFDWSTQVDCSLSLVRLGKEQNIPGLEVLCDDLVTMETLVYETSCDLSLTLKELQQLRDIDKLRLLMKNVCSEAVLSLLTIYSLLQHLYYYVNIYHCRLYVVQT